jgi:Domain of unknown function (DUF4340)
LGETEAVVRFKGTLILLLVFAALGGYVYYSDFYHKEDRQKQEEAKKKLFGGEAKDVTEISLEYDGKTATAIRKDEKDWEITSPAGLEADPDAWDQLASSFVQIQKDEVVSAQKTDLVPYGLDKPGITVRVKLKNGSSAGVLFGSENPKKTFTYSKRADNDEVFLVSTSESGSFKKSIADLRNKKVLDFETDNVDSMRITTTGKPDLEIQKSGMDWLIRKPIEAAADAGEVSSFLSSIQFSRASAFADEKIDTKAAGVETPSVKITLHDKKAGADRVLLFGKSPEKDKYYAKDMARPPIFILGMEIIEKTRRPLFDWRDKSFVKLSEGGMTAIDEMDLVRGTEKSSFKKTDGSNWVLADGRKVQQSKISEMLGALVSERALAILDTPKGLGAYGLDKPRVEVALREKGKEVAALKFGSDSTSPAGVYAKSANPAIFTVSKDLFGRLDVKVDDLLETPPAPPAPAK